VSAPVRSATDGGKGEGIPDAPVRSRPGRQRSEAADRAILDAALAVLAEQGYAGFTMAAVIARAGVSSATLYRRWATKKELVGAALATSAPRVAVIDTGTFEDDIAAFVDFLGKSLSRRRDDLSGVLSTEFRHDEELRSVLVATFVTPRRELLGEILGRAHERGELQSVPPLDESWACVNGPLHSWLYTRNRLFTPEFSATVCAFCVGGLRAIASR
jgi:AcrR family transcriptional regulator